MDFQNFQKSNFDGGKFLKIRSFINLPWDHMMSHKKFGPDRFRVLTLDTNGQTDRQAKFIYRLQYCLYVGSHKNAYLVPLGNKNLNSRI